MSDHELLKEWEILRFAEDISRRRISPLSFYSWKESAALGYAICLEKHGYGVDVDGPSKEFDPLHRDPFYKVTFWRNRDA